MVGPAMSHAQALGPGDTIDGRYRLEAPIADGGMSTVFLATDERLDRHVALKLLSPSLAGDASFVHRLELEAKSVARISHPGVVQVFDHGFDRGQAFLVMELVPGGTLREILDERGPMPPHVVLSVLRPVLGALEEAHAQGLIHRDIKPENILVSTSNSVKLADFGLVRAVAESRSTSRNVVMGTAAYLAPEQIATGETDPRSDLYSLGIVAFELLTGRVPFQGDSPVATAYQRLERTVPPPSSVMRGIPEDLDDLVLHATERAAPARIQTAREFLRGVEDVAARNRLFHVPVPAPSSSAWSRARERAALEAEAASASAGGETGETVFDIASRENTDVRATNVLGTRPPVAETTRLAPSAPPSVPGRGVEPGPPAGPAGPAPTAVYQPAPAARPGPGTLPVHPGHDPRAVAADAPGRPAGASPGAPLPEVPASLRRRRGAGCLAAILVLVLVAVLGITGWWIGSGRLVEIPDVSGMSVGEASTALADVGLTSEQRDEYTDDVPDGFLLGTDPASGQKIDPKNAVTLKVSAGSPVVPEISADRSRSATEQALRDHALTPEVARETVHSADVPEGAVVELDPAPGTTLRVGDTVRLTLSSGPAPVDVPDVVGMTLDAATTALDTVGLSVGNVRRVFDESQPAGSVVSADPGVGSSTGQGTPVSLVVSTAAEIPDVRGMPVEEARAALEKAGVEVVDGAPTSDEEILAGRAASTTPAAGTKVDAATTTVTLTASNSVKVPMILGNSVDDAVRALRDAGLRADVGSGRGGIVYGQVPLPGRVVAPNSSVRISAIG